MKNKKNVKFESKKTFSVHRIYNIITMLSSTSKTQDSCGSKQEAEGGHMELVRGKLYKGD